MRADAGGCSIPHHRARPTRRRGRPPREGAGGRTRRGKRSAHANSGRTTAETAGTQGRAPRAQPTATNGSRARERGPLPPLKFPAGCDPKGSTKGGRGERPAGAAGEGGHAPAKPSAAPRPTANQTPEQPPTTAPGGAPRARNRAGSRTTARRGDAKQSAASGQAAQADDGETASGRGSRPTPPHATARREPRQRTAKRRRDGRRRRRPGGNRTREPSRRPKAASAEKRRNRTPQHARDRRGGREPRRPRAAARTHAGRGHLARTRRRPASRERNGPTPDRRAGARKPGQGRRGKRQERRRAHRPAKRRERRERREPPARSWPAAAATLGREACARLCRQPFPCPLSCVFLVWVE